ncbi:hypothetical protein Tco_0674905 [Tanacetum coccineum]
MTSDLPILHYIRLGSLPVRSMMGGIDISTLTLEQYFRLIEENPAPSMVNDEFRGTMEKDIEDMTITETSDYPYYADDAKIDACYNLPPLLPCFKPIQRYTKHKNESSKEELEVEISYMSDGESLMSEQDTSDNTDAPNLEPHDKEISSDDDVDEWLITEMEEHKKRGITRKTY